MSIRASGDHGIRDWMDVGVLGYRTHNLTPLITPALAGTLAGRSLVSIVEVANHPARIETTTQKLRDDETGQWLEVPADIPVWVDPLASGSTPMSHVLIYARAILEDWIKAHADSFPPLVVHITDGASQDGDPTSYADELKQLATSDGNVLLLNCHLSSTSAPAVLFPASEACLPDDLARQLFRLSSPLPEPFQRAAAAAGMPIEPGARGMAFNADMAVLVQFLDMGTRATAGRG